MWAISKYIFHIWMGCYVHRDLLKTSIFVLKKKACMLTYCVTIDNASNSDIFLKLMNELKFVVKVKPEIESAEITALDLALPGEPAKDEVLEALIEMAEKSGRIPSKNSQKKNIQRFNSWQRKALK